MPCSFLFFNTILVRHASNKKYWIHFLPAVLYIIDYAPFFFSSTAHKKILLSQDLNGSLFDFSQGRFLPEEFYHVLILALPLAYWFAQLLRMRRASLQYNSSEPGITYWTGWLIFYLALQALILVPSLLSFMSGDALYWFKLSFVFALVGTAFMVLSLFIHPDLPETGGRNAIPGEENLWVSRQELQSVSEKDGEQSLEELDMDTHISKPLSKLSKDQISDMKQDVESFLGSSESFLKRGYSLQELADSLSLPLYQLSALINKEYGMNFNDLINKHRIGHALKIIQQENFKSININALAGACGFNNRNSFTTAFKKFTGLTPSGYFKVRRN
jgi:AraC-like DNA-binding protein